MLYVKLDSQGNPCETPISEPMLRRRFPQTTLPRLTVDVLLAIGYAEVPEVSAPPRLHGHATVPDIPVKDAAGTVVRTFRYVPYTNDGLRKRMDELRVKRNKLLADSDWTQAEDVQAGMSASQKQEWLDYRAALRNITEDFTDPNIVTMPTLPASPVLPVVDTQSAEAAIKRRIAARRIDAQGAGMPFVFPDGLTGTVQTRHVVDIQNILGQHGGALAMVALGDTTTQLPFRDEQNITHMLTPQQMLGMTMATLAFVSGTYATKWALEQQLEALIASGATTEQIMAFDIEAGW